MLGKLLDNAITFTPRGQIVVGAERADASAQHIVVRIRVHDSGIRSQESMQRQLFQPSQQAESPATRRYDGIGLGLAISKRVITRMGGANGVERAARQSATFWFQVSFHKASPLTA